jgi:membrane-associated protease RseP (regulator of RpoE activity)
VAEVAKEIEPSVVQINVSSIQTSPYGPREARGIGSGVIYREDGRAEHPYLGVSLVDLTPEIANRFGLSVESGAIITGVDPDGPASDAGIEPGGVVTAVEGEEVTSTGDLLAVLRRYDPGETVEISVAEGGEAREFTVELEETKPRAHPSSRSAKPAYAKRAPTKMWSKSTAGLVVPTPSMHTPPNVRSPTPVICAYFRSTLASPPSWWTEQPPDRRRARLTLRPSGRGAPADYPAPASTSSRPTGPLPMHLLGHFQWSRRAARGGRTAAHDRELRQVGKQSGGSQGCETRQEGVP